MPPPPDQAGGSGCSAVSARVDGVEQVSAVPILLSNGGYRVWFIFQNNSAETMEIGSVTQATFTDRNRQTLTVAQMPSESSGWFMPFTVGANATARVSVVFDTQQRPDLARVEARQSHVAGQPLQTCVVQSTL